MNHSYARSNRENNNAIHSDIYQILQHIAQRYCKKKPQGIDNITHSCNFMILTQEAPELHVELIKTHQPVSEILTTEDLMGCEKPKKILETLDANVRLTYKDLVDGNPMMSCFSEAIHKNRIPVDIGTVAHYATTTIKEIVQMFLEGVRADKNDQLKYECKLAALVSVDSTGQYLGATGACVKIEGYTFRVRMKYNTAFFEFFRGMNYNGTHVKATTLSAISVFNTLIENDGVFSQDLLMIPTMPGQSETATIKAFLDKFIEDTVMDVAYNVYKRDGSSVLNNKITEMTNGLVRQILEVHKETFYGHMRKKREKFIFSLETYLAAAILTATNMLHSLANVEHDRHVKNLQKRIAEQQT